MDRQSPVSGLKGAAAPPRAVAPLSRGFGRWTVLALLVLTTAVNLIDRQLPFIMAEPLKHEFGLSDTQIALLGGLGFSLVYALAALPLARLADRWSRRWVTAACVFAWSLCTASGAFARTFPTLVATRSGVAIGEAGAAPAAHSLISDLFHDGRRPLALAINTGGITLGIMLGMGVGGLLLERFSWRTVLLLAAIPGFLLALLFAFFVAEPPRIGDTTAKPPPLGAALSKLWKQRSFVWLAMGAACTIFSAAGGTTFGASFFIRVHHLSIGEAGLVIGVIAGVAGTFGAIVSGVIVTPLSRRDARWALWLPALACAFNFPLYGAAWLVGDAKLALALLLAAHLFSGCCLPMSYAATQAIAEPRMRAFSSAVSQLVVNIFGNVAGPLAVGMLSDHLQAAFGARSIGLSLSICGSLFLVGGLCYWRGAAFHRQDLESRRRLDAAAAPL